MKCGWNELLDILPGWIAAEAEKQSDSLEEIRVRQGRPLELVQKSSRWSSRNAAQADIQFIINAASRYSPWASQSMAAGYLTAKGGHRIGLCGEAVMNQGQMTGFRQIRSLNLRIARDFPGIADKAQHLDGNILLIGPPGSGKTTLLRDLLRQIAERENVSVVDEREELFPEGIFTLGKKMDVLSGCPKPVGIQQVLKTMGPACIGIDEITSAQDCEALLQAGWCGVRLIATAHAASVDELRSREIYRPLQKLFDHVLVLRRDKTWHRERMER